MAIHPTSCSQVASAVCQFHSPHCWLWDTSNSLVAWAKGSYMLVNSKGIYSLWCLGPTQLAMWPNSLSATCPDTLPDHCYDQTLPALTNCPYDYEYFLTLLYSILGDCAEGSGLWVSCSKFQTSLLGLRVKIMCSLNSIHQIHEQPKRFTNRPQVDLITATNTINPFLTSTC